MEMSQGSSPGIETLCRHHMCSTGTQMDYSNHVMATEPIVITLQFTHGDLIGLMSCVEGDWRYDNSHEYRPCYEQNM